MKNKKNFSYSNCLKSRFVRTGSWDKSAQKATMTSFSLLSCLAKAEFLKFSSNASPENDKMTFGALY